MDILINGLAFGLTFFTIGLVTNWVIRIRKEMMAQPSNSSRIFAVSVVHAAPLALIVLACFVWYFRASTLLPEIIGGMVSAPIVLYWLYKIDTGKKKNVSKSNENSPRNVA